MLDFLWNFAIACLIGIYLIGFVAWWQEERK